MTESKRPPSQITDPTGRTVADSIRRHREKRGMSTYDPAKKLTEAGRPMSPSAVGKVERKERKVDVGDLMAFAVALDVSPIALLMPPNQRGGVELTGGGTVNGRKAWKWAQAREPLRYPPGADEETRSRTLTMWLITSTPEGVGFDLTTAEGTASALKTFKAAYGASESGDADGPGVD